MTTHRKWNYEGKVAFVTGAANGIGQTTALAFAQEGADVVVVDLSEDGAKATARMIEEQGGRALAVRCDVSNPEDVQVALAATIEKFGRLDFAFNNAGIEQPLAYTADVSVETFERNLRVNLGGVFYCMKHQIPLMLKNGGGAIVNTSSGAGVVGIRGQGAYCAAKHGVIGLTKSAALEYAKDGVRINAVCPGIIDTPMIGRFTQGTEENRKRMIAQEPIGRLGRPEEIANTVLWLCSDVAGFAIGHAVVVDGGQTAGL
ncbi:MULTISPECIES: SDR family oxidoreductase [Paraburkholderia]|uniref:NAD(P)-dependent dehydrogenase (Short-subunit alcohol dehydrogenase family) n=2 Tax=Paraburkholderia TaxID=1822464 RepID=A0A7W8P1Z4_9BURK|nr:MULTISPECIES: SDR family oxidoreductase [Paraburkholderia]MBB5399450.1 NAD(P)-dependent dehydrogenase (short-subunit alcohol dehydrogenase family) [Paraburkholderia youngii]MBB5422573.1 NAD(P)-dependent dehydrogenase (short-subunit alcohol dehydrogenase family) [Paraburkholderia atlantica]NUX99465.1 SDR family oxidoreductase [Paraburkholderia youngii]